jgi:hypothetical protein
MAIQAIETEDMETAKNLLGADSSLRTHARQLQLIAFCSQMSPDDYAESQASVAPSIVELKRAGRSNAQFQQDDIQRSLKNLTQALKYELIKRGPPDWTHIKEHYANRISGDPVDDQAFPNVRLHTYYRDHGHADSVLGRITDDAAAVLRPTNEGMSSESGSPKYHVVHEGSLAGKQIKEYLITVVNGGGEVWEVLL